VFLLPSLSFENEANKKSTGINDSGLSLVLRSSLVERIAKQVVKLLPSFVLMVKEGYYFFSRAATVGV